MPMIRINAVGDRPQLHLSPRPVAGALLRSLSQCRRDGDTGPVIVMIHGYKYQPDHPQHCPHRQFLALHPQERSPRPPSWPRQLGFGTGLHDEGLGIAFGWSARGALWSAQRRAVVAGRALARLVALLHRADRDRPVHLIAHSMGTELALEALHHLPAGHVARILSLTGACYRSRAEAALATPAGRAAEFINVISRENDPYDFLFERLIAPPERGDRSLGQGLRAENAVNLQLDCEDTLAHLGRMGAAIAPPDRRVCHWSSYTRPGVMPFYKALMRRPEAWSLAALRAGLPERCNPRWSRLIAMQPAAIGPGMTQPPG